MTILAFSGFSLILLQSASAASLRSEARFRPRQTTLKTADPGRLTWALLTKSEACSVHGAGGKLRANIDVMPAAQVPGTKYTSGATGHVAGTTSSTRAVSGCRLGRCD